jgi:hypothetical protein
MKIIAKEEYEFKWVSIWVGDFESHDELQARAEAVLMPEVDGSDYDFLGLAEWTGGGGESIPLADMMTDNFMWTIYDVPPVLAAADAPRCQQGQRLHTVQSHALHGRPP